DGADLHTEASVSFVQATLGDRIKVPTIDGEVEVALDPGTQPGEVTTLKGRGLPRLQQRGTGDLHVHFRVIVPKSITPEQEQHLRAFGAAAGEPAPAPSRPSLFRRRKKG